jgi:hypothetical protein
MLVNHSISEKNIANFLTSQSSFISHEFDNISFTIAFETYSDKALLSFSLLSFSVKYFIIFQIIIEKGKAKNNSKRLFKIYQLKITAKLG